MPKGRVFISYDFGDKELMNILRLTLQSKGIRPYVAVHDIRIGESLSNKLKKAIGNSYALIPIITKKSSSSASVNQEIGFARDKTKVIPMVEEGLKEKIGVLMQDLEYTEFTRSSFQQKCEEVATYILKLLRKKSQSKVSRAGSQLVSSPYGFDFLKEQVYLFDGTIANYRRTSKHKELAPVSRCPVFLPKLDVVSFPKFGQIGQCVYVTQEAPSYFTFSAFSTFIKKLDNEWNRLIQQHVIYSEPGLYWTISDNDEMFYGVGTDNLLDSLMIHGYGTMAAIRQGSFGNNFDSTCLLIIGSYWKENRFRGIQMSLYLSSVPTKWRWIESLYSSLHTLMNIRIPDSWSIKSYPVMILVPKNDSKITDDAVMLGGLLRKGFRDPKYHDLEKEDQFEGIIIKSDKLRRIKYRLDKEDSANYSFYSDIINPFDCLDEVVVSLISPVPTNDELVSRRVNGISMPESKIAIFGLNGFEVYAISIRSNPSYEFMK